MDITKKLFLLAFLLSWILSVQGNSYANNDYVCSYYQTACSCTWETSWREDGTKHCIGTRQTGTRIGNTRVGCPSTTTSTMTISSYTCGIDPVFGYYTCDLSSTTVKSWGDYGTVDYFNNGGYMFGDINGTTVSCDIVKYDPKAPIASASANPKTGISAYTGTIVTDTACDMTNGPSNPTDCSPVTDGSGSTIAYTGTIVTDTACDMTNGPSNPTDCTPITKVTWHTFHPLCTDNESGCKPVPADFYLKKSESKEFTVYDKAKNSASCTAYGDGTFGGCSGIVFPGNEIIPINNTKCTFANGVSCTPDHTAPIAQISYSPASCTNTNVSVVNSCVRDIDDSGSSPWSGCRWAPENKATLSIASNQVGTLGIADGAGNIKDLPWDIDWIDKTPPYALQFATKNQKAGTSNVFAISGKDDSVAAGCGESDLSFRLDISGADTKTITGKTPRDGTVTTAMLGLTKKGNYTILATITDQAGNSINTTYNNLTIYPADPDASKSSVTLISPNKNSLYANNTNQYQYKLVLKDAYDNPINGKNIIINQEDNGLTGFKTVKTDMTNPSSPTGGDALSEEWTWTTDNNGELSFTLKSTAPGVFTERFKLSLKKWGDDYIDTNTEQSISVATGDMNSFKKPFIGTLSVTTPPYSLTLGTVLTMKLGVEQKSSISSYNINQFKDQVNIADTVNQELLDKQDATDLNTDPLIDFRIGAKTDAWVSIAPSVVIHGNPVISYSLWWQNIRYRLSATDDASDMTDLSIWWMQTNSLKVVWTLQWQGKQTLVQQKSNFSDISKSDMRTIIRKNAYTLIRGMTSGQTIGGVKYIEGDTTLSWEPAYETLIVKNGNLSITGNSNTSGKKFGIIILRDDATKTTSGNIYIRPGVRYVNAAIYADGGMISTGFWNDTVGNYKDSASRTATLNKQLVINGTMFTRNTIGGAIKGTSGKYILPGGATTTDFNLAMMYDLNYLRRGNEWHDVSGTNGTKDYNKGNIDNVVIIPNPSLQTNPPKGFK